MSYSTIIHVVPGVRHRHADKLQNSWGSAPPVWNYLAKKYISPDYCWLSNTDNGAAVWELAADSRLLEWEKLVLKFTFDRAYVKRENFAKLAEYVGAFVTAAAIPENSANWWPTIRRILLTARVPGIALYCSSISECQWCRRKRDSEPWSSFWEIFEGERT